MRPIISCEMTSGRSDAVRCDRGQRGGGASVGVGVALPAGKAPLVLSVRALAELPREAGLDLGRGQTRHLPVVDLGQLVNDRDRHPEFPGASRSGGRGSSERTGEDTVDVEVGGRQRQAFSLSKALIGQRGIELPLSTADLIPPGPSVASQKDDLETSYRRQPATSRTLSRRDC